MDIGTLTGSISIEDEISDRLTFITQRIKQFSSDFEGLAKTVVLGGSAIVGAVVGMSGAIIGLGNRGADVNDVAATFENFSGSIDTAKASMDAMREGTLGTVTDFDLMKSASKLLAGDVRLTSAQFGDLSRAAFILQNQGLGPTKDMLELVSQAMLTGRTRSLEMKIGKIDLEKATKDLAKTLGVETSQLNEAGKTTARQNAIIDALNRKVREAGEQQRDFGENMEFAITKIKNWGDELAKRVASSSAVTDAVNKIGEALVRNFGGAGQTAIEVIVSWIDRFAKNVAYYGPMIIDAVAKISQWILDVWKSIRKSWDDAPEWFKRMTIAAGGATLAIKGTQLAVEGITGADILTNVASAATIWSGFGNAIIRVANALKSFAAISILTVQIGGISALMSGIGTSIAGLAASLVSIPALATAAFVGLGFGIWKVAEAISAAAKSSETWWEILTRKDDDNWLRRLLGLTTQLKEFSDIQKQRVGEVTVSPGYISGGASAARQRDEALNAAQGYGVVKDLIKESNGELQEFMRRINFAMGVRKEMTDWIKSTADGLKGYIREQRGELDILTDIVPQQTNWLENLIHARAVVAQTIPDLQTMNNKLGDQQAKIHDVIEAAKKNLEEQSNWKKISGYLGDVGDILDAIPGKFAEIGAMAARAGQAIMENLAKGDWVGALIAGTTAAIGIFGKLFGFGDTDYEKRTKEAAANMKVLTAEAVKAAGNMARLALNADMVGINIKAAFDSRDPEFLKQVLDDMGDKTQKLNAAMQEYGFTWVDLGDKYRAAALGDQFDELFQKTQLLKGAGINYEEILNRQAEQYSTLVQQAIATNTEIPLAMKPVLEDLIKQKKLLDENGVAFEDLDDASWSKTLTQGFDEVTDAIHELTDALVRGVGGAIDDLNKRKIHIQTEIDTPNVDDRNGGYGEPSYFSRGGNVIDFRPKGSDTVPAMLTPGERVIPRGGGSGKVVVELDRRFLAEVVVPEIPGAVKRLGLGRR